LVVCLGCLSWLFVLVVCLGCLSWLFVLVSKTTIPYVKLTKSKTNIWIAEKLFHYPHLFLLPDFFESEQFVID